MNHSRQTDGTSAASNSSSISHDPFGRPAPMVSFPLLAFTLSQIELANRPQIGRAVPCAPCLVVRGMGGSSGSFLFVGINYRLELWPEGFEVLHPAEQEKRRGIGVPESEHGIADLLLAVFDEVADETQAGLAVHGPVFPAIGADGQLLQGFAALAVGDFFIRPGAERLLGIRPQGLA